LTARAGATSRTYGTEPFSVDAAPAATIATAGKSLAAARASAPGLILLAQP
jgi:hypothetical protein